MAVGEGTPAPEEACKANERSWDLTFGSARPVWGAAGGLEPPHATRETRASSNEGAMCMADYTPATPVSPGGWIGEPVVRDAVPRESATIECATSPKQCVSTALRTESMAVQSVVSRRRQRAGRDRERVAPGRTRVD